MIKSMTGFGSAEGALGGMRATVEVRSVNHRFLNPSIKLPTRISRWEGEVREALRGRIARGHVTVSARLETPEGGDARIDEARFAAYVAQLRVLQQRHNLAQDIDVGSILRLPNVLASDEEDPEEGSAEELVTIVNQALDALDAMRRAEGERLAVYITERLNVVEERVNSIEGRAPQRLTEQRDRLRQNVRELAEGVAVDEQRLAQELAIMADRLDVGEELARFRSHIAAFRETLSAAKPDGVGKRLGFLLQELLRETNTTGSKANDAAILEDVVVIKEELERIREQVENLE
jgi:uncharacterized protein (TIGR00255 family)